MQEYLGSRQTEERLNDTAQNKRLSPSETGYHAATTRKGRVSGGSLNILFRSRAGAADAIRNHAVDD